MQAVHQAANEQPECETELLSAEEEQILVKRWQMHQDRTAYSRLMQCATALVIWFSMRYRHQGMPREDLIQYGFIGAHHGLRRYRPDEGKRLGACLAYSIHAEIVSGLVSEFPNRPFKTPVEILNAMKYARAVAGKHYTEHGWCMSDDMLIEQLCSIKNVLPSYEYSKTAKNRRLRFVLGRQKEMAHGTVSLDAQRSTNDGRTKHQAISDNRPDLAEAYAHLDFLKRTLDQGLALLTPWQAKIIRLRYGIGTDSPLIFKDIAAQFDCKNHQSYQATEMRAMTKLRKYFLAVLSEHDREAILAHLRTS